jgi:hypothetical protein
MSVLMTSSSAEDSRVLHPRGDRSKGLRFGRLIKATGVTHYFKNRIYCWRTTTGTHCEKVTVGFSARQVLRSLSYTLKET